MFNGSEERAFVDHILLIATTMKNNLRKISRCIPYSLCCISFSDEDDIRHPELVHNRTIYLSLNRFITVSREH